jgi:hypothetical protein
VKSGGFSLFGEAPANSILTAYGLLEFGDLAKVRDVDSHLLERVQKWLAGLQNGNGSWPEAEGFTHAGPPRSDALRRTSFIVWGLIESGYTGPEVQKAIGFIKSKALESDDPYALSLALIALSAKEPESQETQAVAGKLVELARTEGDSLFWSGDRGTFTGAYRGTADIETTGLATYALLRANRAVSGAERALSFLVRARGKYGAWGTTQGTVWAMKALMLASSGAAAGEKTVTIYANGQKAATVKITKEDSDVMRQIDLAEYVKPGANTITMTQEGEGSTLFQIAGRYSIPWLSVPPNLLTSALTIDLAYDKTTLTMNDTVLATATIKNISDRQVENAIVELGVPPGFELIREKLDAAVAAKQISRYTQTGRQIILYVDSVAPRQELTLQYELRARFPIKARTPRSAAYPYYNPELVSISPPKDVLVSR